MRSARPRRRQPDQWVPAGISVSHSTCGIGGRDWEVIEAPGIGWDGMRGRPNDIATSRAFIPPWSLAASSHRGEGKTGLLSDQASRSHADRNPSDPEDDANCFAPLGSLSSDLRASDGEAMPARRVGAAARGGGTGARGFSRGLRTVAWTASARAAPRPRIVHAPGPAHHGHARRAPSTRIARAARDGTHKPAQHRAQPAFKRLARACASRESRDGTAIARPLASPSPRRPE